jgi:hypothetical protein
MTETSTVAKLAYVILASMNTAMYHLYAIQYKNVNYESMPEDEESEDATLTKLFELNLKKKDALTMEYDFGTTHDFTIEVIDIKEVPDVRPTDYPKIIDGRGKGIAEDTHVDELARMLKNDEGFSSFTIDGVKKYNLDDYDVKKDNRLLHGRLYKAITAYEECE